MTTGFAFRFTQVVLGGVLAASAASPALAQSSSPAQALLDDSFVFNLGAFVVQTDVTANLNGTTANNPEIDFDQTFGKASDATRVRADMLWRINPKHHLRFMYFDNDVDREKVLDEPVEWGDYTFEGNVKSTTDYKIYALAYEYAFMRQPTYEVAASIGLHYTELSLTLSGTATVTGGGNGGQTGSATKEASLDAPLPVIGLRGGWVVAPQWYIDAQLQYFQLEVDGVDGRVTDARVGATWMFSRHLGVGLGYNRFYTRIDASKDTFDGSAKFGYSGLQAYLTGTF